MIARHLLTVVSYDVVRIAGRWSFGLALLGLMALAKLFWFDPQVDGAAMLAVRGARVAYDSQLMALTFSSNVMLFVGLVGFYVVRGDPRRDWQSGMGSVIAALPVSSASLLLARWLAAVLCMALLALAALLPVLLIHLRQVAAPLQGASYVFTWFGVALPCIVFAASAAVCCDAYLPLIGRLGDAIYFVIWMGSAFAMEAMWQGSEAPWNPLLLIDFAGHYSILVELSQLFGTTAIKLERAQFDPALAVLTMPYGFWSWHMVAVRSLSVVLAVSPLWLALRRFHRYRLTNWIGPA